MASDFNNTLTFENIKQFKCPKCGAELRVVGTQTCFLGCPSCGTVIDVQSKNHAVVMHQNEPAKYLPKSFLRIGMTAEFEDIQHIVIGRTRWQSDYQEYWADDEGSGYSTETWHYDEWVLMSQNQTYFYLTEDDEGYSIPQPFTPKYPSEPYKSALDNTETNRVFSGIFKHRNKHQQPNFNTNARERVLEYGQATLKYFEGEVSYEIWDENPLVFSMYRDGGDDFVVEAHVADDGTYEEIEYFREEPIGKKWLMERFSNDPRIAPQLAEAVQILKSIRSWQVIFGSFFVVFLFLLFTTFSGGKQIFRETFSVPAAKDTTKTDIQPSLVGQIINFKLETGTVRLRLEANLPNGSDVWAGVEIAKANGQTINAIDSEFYYEAGSEDWVEGGESGTETWEESQTNREELYRVSEPGTYTARVFVAPTSPAKTQVTVSITTGASPSGFYWAGILVCLLGLVTVTVGSWSRMPWR